MSHLVMSGTSGLAIALGLRGRRLTSSRARWLLTLAVAAAIAAATALAASQFVGRPPLLVALILAAGSAATTAVARRGRNDRKSYDLLLTYGVVVISLLAVPAIVWLHRDGLSGAVQMRARTVGVLLGVSATVFGVSIARSFAVLGKLERQELATWTPDSDFVKLGEETWYRIVGLCGAFLVNGLLAVAVVLEVYDPATCTRPSHLPRTWILPAAAGAAGLACAGAWLLNVSVRKRSATAGAIRSITVGVLLVAAGVIWGVAPYLIARPSHIELFALLVAAGAFALFLHGLCYHAAREDLEEPTGLTRVGAWALALGCASALFWLLSTGIWSGDQPVRPTDAISRGMLVLLTSGAIIVLALATLQQRSTKRRRTTYPAVQNIVGDLVGQLLLGVVLIVMVGWIGQVSVGCRGASAWGLLISVLVIVPTTARVTKVIYQWLAVDWETKAGNPLPQLTDHQRKQQRSALRYHLVLQAGWALALGLSAAIWFIFTLASNVRLI